MKTKFVFLTPVKRATRFAVLIASGLVCWQALGQGINSSTNSYGSGQLYKTTVERHTEGDLSADDLHQAALLTSQLLKHVNNAAQQLADARTDGARAEIEKAQALLKIVRGLLPTTTVTTTVTDAHGNEIYRDKQQVQDDQIPIFAGDIAVDVVEPIVEAKKDEAALKGLKLSDAELIHTVSLADLSYVERKLQRALELLAKPQDAAAELALIQSEGVQFFAQKEDSPLVNVQHALQLAERQVREQKYEGALANLQTAKLQLDAYRALVGDVAGQAASNLEKEIQKLSSELQNPGAADSIRGMWDKVASWFTHQPGEAHQTTNSVSQASSGK